MRTINFSGRLAEFVGQKSFQAEFSTVGEAVRCMLANWPGLEAHMCEQDYRVIVEDQTISEEEIAHPSTSDIQIIPVVTGSGGGDGFWQVIAGTALLAFALINPFSIAVGTGILTSIGTMGASLILGGVASMLTPLPEATKFDEAKPEDIEKSFAFSNTVNTAAAGSTIPICYGEIITGSIVISSGQFIENDTSS